MVVFLEVLVVILCAVIVYLFIRRPGKVPLEDIGAIKAQTEHILHILQETYMKLETQRILDEELQRTTRKIENALLGSKSRGEMGENIIYEALKQFPPDMIDINFKVNGKPVEYAIVLSDGKRLPIDSKWVGVDGEKDVSEIDIERVISRKAKEVMQYIDPTTTIPLAIAAVPDSIFSMCKQAHIKAYRENRVLIMPYSMTIPYILALYSLHRSYSKNVDIQSLHNYLSEMSSSLNRLETVLENSIARSITMANNAYTECKQIISKMKGAVEYLENSNKVEGEDGKETL
ncbi:MAG: DNA recombination protein RmuC [bacterium]